MGDKLAIMQAYFFPYIGCFQLIDVVEEFPLYEHLIFRKHSCMTRNNILGKGSQKPFYIRVPASKKSSNSKILNISINKDSNWKNTVLNSLFLSYKKVAFFN